MVGEKITDLMIPYLNGERLVRVFVPAHEEGERLPVIYMSDGQSLFEEEKCPFGCWHVREAVRDMLAKTGKSAIVAGIYNDNDRERVFDLTPAEVGKIQYPNLFIKIMAKLFGKPRGEMFDDFIINSVMPCVEQKFPVKTGRENTAFCGSSSGGLFSFFTALSHPEIYGFAGVFSPAFIMFKPEDLEKWIRSKLAGDMPFLSMYMGNGDDKEKELYPGFAECCDILERCYPQGQYKKTVNENALHNESAWEPLFRDLLEKMLNG